MSQQGVYCRSFIQSGILDASVLDMYSDASRNFKLGFGALCGSEWTYGQGDEDFCEQVQPSIEYLELFAVTVGILNWLKLYQNKKIVLFCDNEAVVCMINNSTSNCKNCMCLLRIIILESLVCNTRVYVKYVRSKDNRRADAMSRLQLNRFKALAKDNMSECPLPIPDILWPIRKIWIF